MVVKAVIGHKFQFLEIFVRGPTFYFFELYMIVNINIKWVQIKMQFIPKFTSNA